MDTFRAAAVGRVVALIVLVIMALSMAPYAEAQLAVNFAGERNAFDYAFGYGQFGLAYPALQVSAGNAATGASQTITLVTGASVQSNGSVIYPIATNAPITVGIGANAETVTPTAVSNCNLPPTITPGPGSPTCTITGTFNNLHGPQEPVISGTYGLQEAINAARAGGQGLSGGVVVLSPSWATAGGTSALITAAAGYSNVAIKDNRGPGPAFWSLQPSTLTSLAVPTTLAAGTVVFAAAPVGTWANSAYYFCVTYVDALGGEGPCSLTYNQTPTLNYSVTITAPAASTGAVGWRFYAGASYNAAYLMPIDSTHCVLTTLESVMPACAMAANGGWIAPPLTTTSLRPNATVSAGALASPTVNISATQPQGHTTFAYQPSSSVPQAFQTHYGPFPVYGSTTSGQVDTLGSINLPAGFLNYIGRSVKIRGKITTGSANTAALPTITVLMSWVAGTTAGVGLTTCSFEGVAVGATKTYTGPFECVLDTNAVGATAIGSVMPSGYLQIQPSDISAAAQVYTDSNVAAVGSLGLFAQDTINIVYTSNTNTSAAPQLLSLDVEVSQ